MCVCVCVCVLNGRKVMTVLTHGRRDKTGLCACSRESLSVERFCVNDGVHAWTRVCLHVSQCSRRVSLNQTPHYARWQKWQRIQKKRRKK